MDKGDSFLGGGYYQNETFCQNNQRDRSTFASVSPMCNSESSNWMACESVTHFCLIGSHKREAMEYRIMFSTLRVYFFLLFICFTVKESWTVEGRERQYEKGKDRLILIFWFNGVRFAHTGKKTQLFTYIVWGLLKLQTLGASQIASSCSEYLMFWVQKCVKCTEKYVKVSVET